MEYTNPNLRTGTILLLRGFKKLNLRAKLSRVSRDIRAEALRELRSALRPEDRTMPEHGRVMVRHYIAMILV